jgi:hypothetical protein
VFKALNDKWIAGGDYKTKTLFEDILFLDRASRNIGDTLLIDIFALKDMFSRNSLNMAMSVFTFISGILIKNNFNVMPLPAYVNFYNVQDVSGTVTPKSEGSLAFANSLWGTFLDVDYRKSGPKLICFYAGKPSQYLQLPQGSARYRDDGFDLTRSSENPLIEDQQGKKDWAVSNKCVGFNVDIGIKNQNVFSSFSVSQDAGVATSEAINTVINIVDQATGKNTATQNVGLYNLYKQRSYKCNVVSLGNALIQPTMYFNLRHVPMFNGPYLIQDVTHHIQPGNFTTTFTGVRQGIFDLPAIDSFLQTMNQNLLTELEAILKIKKNTFTVIPTTNAGKSDEKVQKADNSPDTTNSCKANVDPVYVNYEDVKTVLTTVTPEQFAKALDNRLKGNTDLQSIIYRISYVTSFQTSSSSKTGVFNGWNNNLGLISLKENWGNQIGDFLRTYSCVNVKTNASTSASLPMANFKDLDAYIIFMSNRLSARVDQINDIGLDKFYVCCWPNDTIPLDYYDSHLSSYTQVRDTLKRALGSARDAGILTTDEIKAADAANKKTESNAKTPGLTPTPTPIPPLPGKTCPPPVISSFYPQVGNTGSMGQITGRNLETVTFVTVIDTIVPLRDITVVDDNTLKFVVPQVGTGKEKKIGKISVTTSNGSFSSISDFVYDPALNPAAASSPGDLIPKTSPVTTTQSNTTNLNTVDTNPQNTGQVPLIATTDDKNTLGSTTNLVVKVNSNAGVWEIDSQPTMNYRITNISTDSNGKIIETDFSTGNNVKLLGYVTTDGQEFNITQAQMINEFKKLINDSDFVSAKIYTTIGLYARSLDPIAHPQDVPLSFPFNLVFDQNGLQTVTNTTTISAVVTQPVSQESITFIGKSGGLQGNGPQYFNIEDPNGVVGEKYITYKFNTTGGFNELYYGFNVILNSNKTPQPNSGSNLDIATRTNLVYVNSKGVFYLQVQYYPNGASDSSDNGKALMRTVTSEPFTL